MDKSDHTACGTFFVGKTFETPSQKSEMEQKQLALLPPNHPLLEKFQQKLKEYLLQSKAKLTDEIAELTQRVQLNEKQRLEEGYKMYGQQQKMDAQQKQLREYSEVLNSTVDKRKIVEAATCKLNAENADKRKKIKEWKVLYEQRLMELELLEKLKLNMIKWTDEFETKMKMANCVFNRETEIQKKKIEEQSKSDLLIIKLEMEIKKMEKELSLLNEDKSEMTYRIDILKTSDSDAIATLESLQNEQKSLTRSWADVINAIYKRNILFNQVKEDVQEEKIAIKLCTANIQALRKRFDEQNKEKEMLEKFKGRMMNASITLKENCQSEIYRLNELEHNMDKLPQLITQLEMDLKSANREGFDVQTDLRLLQFKLDKKNLEKYKIEENIIKLTQDQLVNNTADTRRQKLFFEKQKERRAVELHVLKSHTNYAYILSKLEELKCTCNVQERKNAELREAIKLQESKSNNIANEIKLMNAEVTKKLLQHDILSKKYADWTMLTAGGGCLTITEIKIKECESELRAVTKVVLEQQSFWLTLQNLFMRLTQKRNKQISEFSMSRKHKNLIKQKIYRVDGDIDKIKGLTKILKREIHEYETKNEILGKNANMKLEKHQAIENDYEFEHKKLLDNLKVNELQLIELENNIKNLQMEIEEHKDLVLAKHNEALAWETKHKMIEEVLRIRKANEGHDGENACIKNELRQMQKRYEQLKREQEKLKKNIEQCVGHLRKIEETVALQRVIDAQPKNACANVTAGKKKIDNLKTRTELIHKNTKLFINLDIPKQKSKLYQLYDLIKARHADVIRAGKQNSTILLEIDSAILQKQINLNKIISKQNHAKLYKKIGDSKLPLPKLRAQADCIEQKQKFTEFENKLWEILRYLCKEFPANEKYWLKLLYTLKG